MRKAQISYLTSNLYCKRSHHALVQRAAVWAADGDTITVTAEPDTDFWRKTHYGFIRDNGHFYYQEVAGDFRCEVKVSGGYAALYDQAGLMVRLDDETWLKCGIEFVEGVRYVSAVVTRDFSDWSVVALPGSPAALWLRVVRTGPAIEISYALEAELHHAAPDLSDRGRAGPGGADVRRAEGTRVPGDVRAVLGAGGVVRDRDRGQDGDREQESRGGAHG